jgi:hypothetical protein
VSVGGLVRLPPLDGWQFGDPVDLGFVPSSLELEAQVLRGIFDASGDLTGEYVYTLAPPSASCTSPATGARTSGAPSATATTTK